MTRAQAARLNGKRGGRPRTGEPPRHPLLKKLTDKQRAFVLALIVPGTTQREALLSAGYKAKNDAHADSMACTLAKNAKVSAAVDALRGPVIEKAIQRAELNAARVLEEMARLGLADPRALFDEQGNIRPIHTLSEDVAATIAAVEVVKRNLTAGDGAIDTVLKLKTWDKPRSLEMLAKHFGLLQERVEHGGEITIRHEL